MGGGGQIAYVRLHYFTGATSRAVQVALLAGEQDGVLGYIFDLRNNPGVPRGPVCLGMWGSWSNRV